MIRIAFIVLAVLLPASASAHPHVWVTMKSELVYASDGSVTAVRHAWTFDEAFSAFAIEGLQHKGATYTREDLASLAEVNVTSLKEFDYFTRAKGDSKRIAFVDPVDYWADYDGTLITLHFSLPLTAPVRVKNLSVEIYDPTWFVDFTFAEKDAVALKDAPAGCQTELQHPAGLAIAHGQQLGEAFFNSLGATSNFGAQFANKVLVQCP
jgi:ABC-type uncharacterized transport system substrate-binding protein